MHPDCVRRDPDRGSPAGSPARQTQRLPSAMCRHPYGLPPHGSTRIPHLREAAGAGHGTARAPDLRESSVEAPSGCVPRDGAEGPPPAEGPAQRQSPGCSAEPLMRRRCCWLSSAAPPARIPAPSEGSSGKPGHQVTPHGTTQGIAPRWAAQAPAGRVARRRSREPARLLHSCSLFWRPVF